MELITEHPNFSIVIPGCSQRCEFCFENDGLRKPNPRYHLSLPDALEALPPAFHQVSITGGEPMEHAEKLEKTINTIRPFVDSGKIDKIVITTNGTRLMKLLSILCSNKDLPICINISRHRMSDKDNFKVFGFDANNPLLKFRPAIWYDVEQFIDASPHPVSISMVLLRHYAFPDMMSFRNFLESLSAYAIEGVTVRVEHGSLAPHPYEDMFEAYDISRRLIKTGCPVCKSHLYLPPNNRDKCLDVPITFKYSCTKTLEEIGGVYELIYHPNGVVSPMWDGSHPLTQKGILAMAMTKKIKELKAKAREAQQAWAKAQKEAQKELDRLQREAIKAQRELDAEQKKYDPPDSIPNNIKDKRKRRYGGGSCYGGGRGAC